MPFPCLRCGKPTRVRKPFWDGERMIRRRRCSDENCPGLFITAESVTGDPGVVTRVRELQNAIDSLAKFVLGR